MWSSRLSKTLPVHYWRHLSLSSSAFQLGFPKVSGLIHLRTTSCKIWREPALLSTWFCEILQQLRKTTQPCELYTQLKSKNLIRSHIKSTAVDAALEPYKRWTTPHNTATQKLFHNTKPLQVYLLMEQKTTKAKREETLQVCFMSSLPNGGLKSEKYL